MGRERLEFEKGVIILSIFLPDGEKWASLKPTCKW
jgi:hypothetical protein